MPCRTNLTRWSNPSTTNAEGDPVANHWTATGARDGSPIGIEPTSTDIGVKGLGPIRIEYGLIAES